MSRRQCAFLLIGTGFLTVCWNIDVPTRSDQAEAVVGLVMVLLGVFVSLPWKKA